MTKWMIMGFMLLQISMNAQEAAKVNLVLNIANIEKPVGNLMIAVYCDTDKFLGDKNFAGQVAKVVTTPYQEMKLSLPLGKYAVAVYHDLNADGKLNTNFLGIPKEPYGFSNDSMGMFGPPSFEEAAFKIEQDGMKITINL